VVVAAVVVVAQVCVTVGYGDGSNKVAVPPIV